MKTKKTTLKEPVQTEILFKSRLKQKIFLLKSKIIWKLNPLPLIVQRKTFQFCKAGEIVSKLFFYY